MSQGQSRSPYELRVGDRVRLPHDLEVGTVMYASLLTVEIHWSGGLVDEREQFDRGLVLVERGSVIAEDYAELKRRLAELDAEIQDNEWTIDDLQRANDDLEEEADEIRAKLKTFVGHNKAA